MDTLKKLNVVSIGNNQVDDENSVSKTKQYFSILTSFFFSRIIIIIDFSLDTLFTSI